MSQGSLRCDANVSIRPAGSTELGTKTELKNMNSFAFLERGVRAEIERQERLLAAGEEVVQETLHFDPVSGEPHAAALQGGGARLPLLPRARPRPAPGHRGDGGRRAGRPADGAAGGARAALRGEARAARRHGQAVRVPGRARRLLRARPGRRRRGRRTQRRCGAGAGRAVQLDSPARRAHRVRRRPGDEQRHPREPGHAGDDGQGQGGQPRRRARGADDARAGRRRPARDRSSARGSARSAPRTTAWPTSSIGRSPPIPRRPSRSARAT